MYTTKFIHKNIMTEAGRYITIGDPYQVRQRESAAPRPRARARARSSTALA
jgi:hypothetical protein